MRILKSKRGGESFSLIWEFMKSIIIAIFFVMLPLIAFVNAIASSSYFEMNYIAKDMSLVTDAVLASPNDLVYNYLQDTKELSVEVKPTQVEVYKGGFEYIIIGKGISYYIADPSIKIPNANIIPIYDYVKKTDKPAEVIPSRPLIIKSGNSLRFFNALAEAIN